MEQGSIEPHIWAKVSYIYISRVTLVARYNVIPGGESAHFQFVNKNCFSKNSILL